MSCVTWRRRRWSGGWWGGGRSGAGTGPTPRGGFMFLITILRWVTGAEKHECFIWIELCNNSLLVCNRFSCITAVDGCEPLQLLLLLLLLSLRWKPLEIDIFTLSRKIPVRSPEKKKHSLLQWYEFWNNTDGLLVCNSYRYNNEVDACNLLLLMLQYINVI